MRKSQQVALVTLTMAVGMAGCGNDLVQVQGKVLIDGEPAPPGQLYLSPVSEGKKAYAAINSDGLFEVYCEGNRGALPGNYRATFKHELDKNSKAAKKLAGGKMDLGEVSVLYEQPKDKLVTIPEEGTEQLTLDIRGDQGWRQFYNE